MGISFKVSKIGKRFRANPPNPPSSPPPVEKPRLSGGVPSKIPPSTQVVGGQTVGDVTSISIPSVTDTQLISPEYEVSFALNLLPDGFYIGKPDEMTKLQAPFFDVAKQLLPYNKTSKTLFSAIESGWLPGDILDDIPCKYYNGALMCEVRDYRKCLAEEGTHGSMQGLPTIKKVILRMSLENIVNDIPTISDDSWTYSDLMEVESRILKFLQPKLHLDPSPMLDRLCSNSNLNNLNIVISGQKRKRVHPAEFTLAPSNQTLGKKVCNDTIPENTNNESGDLRAISGEAAMQNHHLSAITQHASSKVQPLRVGQEGTIPPLSPSSQPQFQTSVGYPRVNPDRFSLGSAIYPAMNAQAPLAQNIMNSYPDTVTNNKRDNHDMVTNKRKHTLVAKEANQHLGLRLEGSTGADIRWKTAVLSQQMDTKGVQYSTSATEAGSSFYRNQQGMKIGIKKEQTETEKLDRQESEKIKNVLQMPEAEGNSLDRQQWRPQQLNQQPFMKAHFQSQKQWQNNLGSPVDKDVRKDDILHKKKQVPSPRISSIPPIQSPISGDISTGTLNGQFGAAAVALSSSYGTQKDKTSTFSNTPLGAASVTTSTSDSFQRQPQSKRKTNSMPKTHTMSGVASPASVSNIGTPLNVSSPSAVATSMTDSAILDGFTSVVRITKRYKLDVKKKKPEKFNKTPRTYSTKEISIALDNQRTSEDVKSDICPMSRSLIDGTMNNCKTRILTYGPPNNSQGVPSRIPQRVVMNEMPKVGTVMMLQSDVESNIPSQDCMFTLPNTHYADLFGTQLRKLVENEGNQIFGDQTTLHMNHTSGNPSFFAAPSSDSVMSEGQQPEGVSGRQSNQALVNITSNDVSHLSSSQILPNSMSMLSPGNSHVLPISQGYLPNGANMTMSMRPQNMEQTLIQQQQSQQQQMHQHQMLQLQQQSQHQSQLQQQAQLQRSSSILQMNPPISHLIGQSSSMQLGGSHMVNKQNQLQHQVLQQQQAHQFPRKGLMGLGAMSMGNSKMGLGGFNNVMGMRGISSPIAPGLSNIAPNQMNLGSVTNFGVNLRPMAAHANAIARLRMAQNRGLYTGQPGMASLSGNNNHMLQSSMGMSMLDQTLRPNMSPIQRNAMTSMGPPKIPGDIYMNKQQLQQMQQQQQHLQLQQQISSPLQQSHVSTPSMMVSSPASTMQQQPIIPQPSQQIAMSPQQLSGGTLQQINNGNSTGPGPSSPQLSSHSQTHGSVGSPLDQLQGASKGGSVNTG